MTEVVLRKINEEINNLSVFHNPRDFACGPDLIAQSICKTPVKS